MGTANSQVSFTLDDSMMTALVRLLHAFRKLPYGRRFLCVQRGPTQGDRTLKTESILDNEDVMFYVIIYP
jgi:hypothetical protein